jgi:23S rRNA (adenine-N6)-dimethyltransferase
VAVRPRSQRGRGQHFLRSSKLASELVRAAGIRHDDLVLDIGAGTGVLTAALARSTDRVVAVEIDPVLGEALRRRFPTVDVLIADAARVPLPREPFKVLANLPFGGATTILRRLLDPAVPLQTANVIVEWAVAAKRAAVWPSTQLGAYWGAWFELSVARRLPRCVFSPPPSVDAAVLRVARRAAPLVPVGDRRRYDRFLAVAFTDGLRAAVPSRELKRYEAELGLDRRARARDLDAHQWAALYGRLAAVRRRG